MTIKKYLVPSLCGLLIGVVNGLFGAGGGVMAIIVLQKFLGYPTHQSHAAAVAIILSVTLVTCIIYLWGGVYNVSLTIEAAIGGVVGGIVGAKLLPKISDKYLHLIFGIFMAVAGIRLIWK